MLRRSLTALVAVVAVASVARPCVARVSVSIGINFPAPPALVAVPRSAVMYAPAAPANYFYYAGRYYVFVNGVWYVSRGYNGPWFAVAPEYVPVPILRVPVRYYRVPPRAWRRWHRERPPRWEARWGRHWLERRHPPRLERRHERHERHERHQRREQVR